MPKKKTVSRAEARAKSTANLRPFKKGDPRINRNGRPKQIVRMQQLLSTVFGIDSDDPITIQKSDLGKILKAMASAAKRGNIHAGNSILDRLYGKPKQVIEIPGVAEAREEVSKLMPFAKPKKD